MSIGERVKMLRTGKGIKQMELAKILNSTSSVLSAIEVNRNEPSIEMLNALSKFFNVSTDYILNGKEESNTISDDEQEVIEIMREDKAFKKAVIEAASFKKKAISYLGSYNSSELNAMMSK